MKRTHVLHLAGALLLTSLGCVREDPDFSVAPAGGARLVVAVPLSVEATGVTSAVTHASGQADSAPLTRDSGGAWVGDVRSESFEDSVAVRVDAVDAAGAVVATASLPELPLPLRGAALVVLVPQPETGAPGFANHAPRIHSVTGSSALVAPGEAVSLTAVASDLEADALTYAWTATAGALDCTEATCTWTAAEPASAVDRRDGALLELTVTDAKGAVSTLQFRVAVGTVRAGASVTDTRFNRAPIAPESTIVHDVTPGQPFQVPAGASDEDGPGDALTFAWTATCEGTFNDAATATPAFTPTAEPAGCGCVLEGAVTDSRGARATQQVNLCVRPEAPPVIGATSQSAASAISGELVGFGVTATDPRNEALTYTWTSNVGAVGATGAAGTAQWTEVSCVRPNVTPTVDVVVTNASGASARHTFTLEWTGRRCNAQETPCVTTLATGRVTLGADCVAQGAVFIPPDFTFDGANLTLTASEDGAGTNFKGAVLRNRGAVANVRGVTVTARNLSDICDAGDDRLRGILLEGAGGTIEDTVVENLHQAGNVSGCQEGFAIDVRNMAAGASEVTVTIRNSRVVGYQKSGVVVLGPVDLTMEDNVIDGLNLTDRIARNGIQVGYGVSGTIVGNQVRNNGYTDENNYAYGAGILVVGGSYYGAGRALCHDLLIQDNELEENDVGIDVSQAEGGFAQPSAPQNIQLLANTVTKTDQTNSYYQAAIFDNGPANRISLNRILGDGYDPAVFPGNVFALDVTTEKDPVLHVAFATPPRTLDAGTCSELLVVQGWDSLGNLMSLSVPGVTLAASDASATFHLSPDCSDAAVTEASLKNPQREGLFYVRAVTPGILTVTATGDGVSATQDLTVR
jgi:hypothetical protein